MKKLFFAVALLAMIVATSCSKESVNEPESETGTTMRAPRPGEFIATIYKNALPQNAPSSVSDGMTTKAQFNGNSIVWQVSDEIAINTVNYTCSQAGSGMAYFTTSEETALRESDAPYYAFSGAVQQGMLSGDTLYGNLYATQTYSEGRDAAHMPMFAYQSAYSENPELEFHNLCGALRIIVPLSTANKIVVTADQDLNGKCRIEGYQSTTPKLVICNDQSTAANKSITLNRIAGTFQNGDVVYIAIPEGNYTHLEIKFMNDDNVEWTTGQSTQSYNIAVNKISKVNMIGAFRGLLPGKFSVSATKQVRFTMGNLYCDKINGASVSDLHFEDSQIKSPIYGIIPAQSSAQFIYYNVSNNHIGHFIFASSVSEAVKINGNITTNDDIFAKSISINNINYTILSQTEWNYLLNKKHGLANVSDGTNTVSCIVVAPDGFTGNLSQTYTLAQVNAAGLLCLPRVGHREYISGDYIYTKDVYGSNIAAYWSTTTVSNTNSKAHYLRSIDEKEPNIWVHTGGKAYGRCIRLVQVVEGTAQATSYQDGGSGAW